ncbi:hypothetical protein SAMN04515695_3748 [Pseudovibrio sp. Tun.PSC04-5.I4]|nr:hypothetical protein SAMN04515695_3748 [Pseudovibrio sp. Tun.PSC04-5.I4]
MKFSVATDGRPSSAQAKPAKLNGGMAPKETDKKPK